MTHFPSKKRGKRIETLYGKCLEAAGVRIPHYGIAVVNSVSLDELEVGDLVICGKIAGQIPPMCKQVIEIRDDTVVVGTAYLDKNKDVSFEVEEIHEVVLEIYDRAFGNMIWQRGKKIM